MNTIQKQKIYQRIEKHGEDLKTIFKLSNDVDSIKLCKQLFRLENKAHRLAEDDYNGLNVEKEVEKVFKSISKILDLKNLNDFKIFFNCSVKSFIEKICVLWYSII